MVSQPGTPRIERRSGHDRRKRWSYRFHDRRSAFDRRKRYPLLGTMRDHPWLLALVLACVNMLSWFDGLLTVLEVNSGLASEGNPVLANLYARHPALAVGVKVALIAGVSIAIWHGRHYRIMLAVAVAALMAFTALLAFHFGSLHGLDLL